MLHQTIINSLLYTAKILLPYGNGYRDECLIDFRGCIYNTSHSNVSKEIVLDGTYTFCDQEYQSVTVSAYFLKYYTNVMSCVIHFVDL